jgi:hypothetical protein
VEREECCEILQKYGVSNEAASMVVRDLCKDREKWVQVSIALLQAVLFCVRG